MQLLGAVVNILVSAAVGIVLLKVVVELLSSLF